MSGKFDSGRDSHLTKFEIRSQIFGKLSFGELCDLKLPGLYPFFVTLTETSSVVTNDTKRPSKYPHHRKQL